MNLPLELTFRGVEKTEDMENLMREKVDKLQEVCSYINVCRIVEIGRAHV